MKHFQWHGTNGDLRFRTGETGNILEATVKYSDGKFGVGDKKGIWVHITPRHLEVKDGFEIATYYQEQGDGNIKVTGAKFFALPLRRKNAHAVEDVASVLDSEIADILTAWITDHIAAASTLSSICSRLRNAHEAVV